MTKKEKLNRVQIEEVLRVTGNDCCCEKNKNKNENARVHDLPHVWIYERYRHGHTHKHTMTLYSPEQEEEKSIAREEKPKQFSKMEEKTPHFLSSLFPRLERYIFIVCRRSIYPM